MIDLTPIRERAEKALADARTLGHITMRERVRDDDIAESLKDIPALCTEIEELREQLQASNAYYTEALSVIKTLRLEKQWLLDTHQQGKGAA